MSLVAFAILIFASAGAAGYILWTSRAWKLIDVVYYPLGAVGVVLLFLHQASERQILELLEQQENRQALLESLEESRPDSGDLSSAESLIAASGKLLRTIPELGRACNRAGSVNVKCTVASNFGSIVDKYDDVFFSSDEDIKLASVCRAAEDMFAEIRQSSRVSSFVSESLVEAYQQGIERGFGEYEFDATRSLIDSFKSAAEDYSTTVVSYIEDNDELKAFVSNRHEAEIEFAGILLESFDVCWRAPEALRTGEFEKWRRDFLSIQTELNNNKEEIESLRDLQIRRSPSTLFSYLVWPYVIVFALALKFGKGVSQLRQRR